MNRRGQKAFTWVELITAVVIIGAIAAIALPRLNFAAISRHKAASAARKIVTDLRRTRGLAIANAATNTSGSSLNITGSSPFAYEMKNLDGGTVLESHTFDSEVSCAGGTRFEFGPLGNLSDTSDTQLTVSAQGKSFTITIIPATGTIKCVES
jgi:prepilin-type N-terminal cleavage/methylation domain-containing protein